jgi:DNA sulfur modification protein DndB
MNTETNKLHLPALRAKMGDWFYYVTVLTFEEVAKRVKQPREIEAYNENEKKLGEWIQRELDPKRINQIVEYLNSQEQRFFNSLVLGIYGGSPFWQDIRFEPDSLDERIVDYINKTLGILTLSGDENIFAIDGQHRAKGIQEAVAKNPELKDEEVSVIFIAHKTDIQGLVRTRRVFSTLN